MLPSYFVLIFFRLGTLSISVGPDSIPATVKCEFLDRLELEQIYFIVLQFCPLIIILPVFRFHISLIYINTV